MLIVGHATEPTQIKNANEPLILKYTTQSNDDATEGLTLPTECR